MSCWRQKMPRDIFRIYLFLLVAVVSPWKATSFVLAPRGKNAQPVFGIAERRRTLAIDTGLRYVNGRTENGKKDVAVGSLEKLLERQRAEVRETERLLKKVSAFSTNTTLEHVEEESGKAAAIASSIMAGVDYGFVSRSEGCKAGTSGGLPVAGFDSKSEPFEEYGPPANLISLGVQQFRRNFDAIRGEYKDEENVSLSPKQKELQAKLKLLTLNSTAIWERETAHGPIEAPLLIKVPYIVLCYLLDRVFEGRYVFSRLFLLETVARMPYFSYIAMLHFYETIGFWRRSADIKRVHFAEEWNEFHHLLIMESLGGDQAWWVRFVAQHSALVYYTVLVILWAISPTLSYKFSELLETHAVNTYGQLLDENEELMKELPPTFAAVEYYSFGASDPFFGEYQTTALASGGEIRQPGDKMQSLHDVFSAIRADEGDHVSTMKACLDPDVAVASPSLEKKILTGVALAATFGYFLSTGDVGDVDGIGDVMEGFSNVFEGAGEDDVALLDGLRADAEGLFDAGMVGAALVGAREFITDIFGELLEILEIL